MGSDKPLYVKSSDNGDCVVIPLNVSWRALVQRDRDLLDWAGDMLSTAPATFFSILRVAISICRVAKSVTIWDMLEELMKKVPNEDISKREDVAADRAMR